LGVRQVFHKVRLKPGKPLWFGVLRHEPRQTLVFGLPGNPVSSLVCFELFVRAAIDRLGGRELPARTRRACLAAAFQHRGERPTYHPARFSEQEGRATILPLRWHGSGDLRTLAAANSLICFPSGDRSYAVGEEVALLMF
jgi:molybdopterin molybdotransferase